MKSTLLGGALFIALITAAPAATQTSNEYIVAPTPTTLEPLTIKIDNPEVLSATTISANTTEIQCLARNIYHEARGEGRSGMRAVGHVTMNRTTTRGFPRTVCGVVYQRGQFSWTRNRSGQSGSLWSTSQSLARDIYTRADRDNTNGAKYFHNRSVRPSWSRRMTMTVRIGAHTFYR